MITYPKAVFKFIDITALEDSNAVSTTAKELSNTALFHSDIRQKTYGTMELNQFVLDGSREILPNEGPEDVTFWSDEKSDANCLYVMNPALEISFSQVHTSVGLTLYFAEDIPAEILVTWYTAYGTKLISQTFYPDSQEYFCKCNVRNYKKIVIEFVRSSYPYRYIKMDHIEYGQIMVLGRDNIKTASIYEEIDPTSATLSINTADAEIIDVGNEFDMTNPEGLWNSLQKEQQIAFTEYVNGRNIDCGSFYLDDWSVAENLVKLAFIDELGRMDKTQFYGGRIYVSEKAGIIIDEIMASCGVTKYSVEEDVYNVLLSGWLGIQTHRAALQQVVFACGAVADCSRSDAVKIYRQQRYVSRTIGVDRKFMGTTVKLDEYVSAVSVAYREYDLKEETEQISKSVLPSGNTRIEFQSPYLAESLSVSEGSIQEASTNYAVISMTAEGECVLSGRKYEARENAYTAIVNEFEAGELQNTKTYSGCTLVDSIRARELAAKILEYHQLRQVISMRYINTDEAVGNWCAVESVNGGHFVTGIISQTLNLAGGNIVTAECRGYSRIVTEQYYADSEIYAGEGGII